MKRSLLQASLLLFGLSILFWVALTVFESSLVGTSFSAQRVITFLLLVLPAGTGAVLGIMSLQRREGQRGRAIAAIVLNTLFALFNLMIILFAG